MCMQVFLHLGVLEVQAVIDSNGASVEAPRKLPREDLRIQPKYQRHQQVSHASCACQQ
jgi:hypothetical protein